VELSHFIHWFHELRHRHVRRVFRAVVAYGLVAFALIEVTEPVMHALHLPEWTLSLVVVLLGLGFPVVAVVTWIFESTGAAPSTAREPTPDPAAAGGDGPAAARPRLPSRSAALLVGLGLTAATPGLVYFFLVRGGGVHSESTAAPPRSIAVLPFADLSPGKDQEYFADGMAEEIVNALAHLEGLRVAGRTSSFYFKGKPATIAEIGRELNVGTILEGSIRKEGNRVRVTAQVIDVARGDHVWSDSYDRELTGIFAVQSEIASAVVEALKVKILPGHGPDVKEHRATNPDAYNAYLLGRHFFDVGTADGMSRAVAALEKSVAADPNYAPAWAWLSVSILNSAVYLSQGGSPEQIEQSAKRAVGAADRAVDLAPDLADCWSARGWMRASVSWDWAGAQEDFRRALALNPRDANILVRESHLLAVLGNIPEAISTVRKALEIDPLYAWAWYFLATYYIGSARPELARDAATRTLEIAPEHIYALQVLGVSHLLLGQPGEALVAFHRQKREALRLTGEALAQHALGNVEEEQKAIALLRARFGESEPYEIALVYGWRGDKDAAFEWLYRAVRQHGGRGFSRLAIRSLEHEPLLRSIRDDPRYAVALEKMGLQEHHVSRP
jgi:serine/threonine-protein kinase